MSKRKVRLSLERLETREVPARLGQIVELPGAASPVADIALTAPADLGQGVGASIKIDSQSLVNVKLDRVEASIKIDSAGSADLKLDDASALRISPQDIPIVTPVSKASAKLFSADVKLDDVSAVKVQLQDIGFTTTVSKHTPILR